MLAKRFRDVSLLAGLCILGIGCGPAPRPPIVKVEGDPNPSRSVEQLKKDLKNIAENGSGGSALQPIDIAIQSLASDYPQRAELAKKAQQLAQAATDNDRKKIATEMLEMVK